MPDPIINELIEAADVALQFVVAWAQNHSNDDGEPSRIGIRAYTRLLNAIDRAKEAGRNAAVD